MRRSLCDDSCSLMTAEEHARRHALDRLAHANGFRTIEEWADYERVRRENEWEQTLFNGEVLLWGYEAARRYQKQREDKRCECTENTRKGRGG